MSYPFVRNPIRSAPVPPAVRRLLAAMIALMASGSLTGCYTQLYTRGYAERAAAFPEYSRAPSVPSGSADTAAHDTGTVGDSGLAAARERDTLYAPPATVVVNNYYRESPYYRGYLINDWDYPSFSFGIYSARYRDYSSPFWWNDPWYQVGGRYHSGYRGRYRGDDRGYHQDNNGGYIPPAGGGGTTGPYQSDKRIFTSEPDHPELRKGRRSYEVPAANPAPKYSSEGAETTSSPSSTKSSSSGSAAKSSSSDSDGSPALKKGRRR